MRTAHGGGDYNVVELPVWSMIQATELWEGLGDGKPPSCSKDSSLFLHRDFAAAR